MDAGGFADVCVDTTGVPAAEAARLVRDSCRDWPGFREVIGEPPGAAPAGAAGPAGVTADSAGGQVLLLCGPAGVGKSTIGFQLYLRSLRAGLTAGYIDLAADAQALDRTHLGVIRIDTDGHTAGEAADLTAAATGWPGQRRDPGIPHHAR